MPKPVISIADELQRRGSLPASTASTPSADTAPVASPDQQQARLRDALNLTTRGASLGTVIINPGTQSKH